ncbi:MAG: IMP dehydrogenase [Ignavibacteriales bacterium]|nr:IMP dehydrogenase [Ignavibacteriales bacterium]
MARKINYEPSRTLMEFRLLPGHTTDSSKIENISLRTPLVYSPIAEKKLFLNIPLVSAAMQSVSGVSMGIELAKSGGMAFIYCSQPIDEQAAMVTAIKKHKAGFVVPRTITPGANIKQLHAIRVETGFNTFPVVEENGAFAGIITRNDYDVKRHGDLLVTERMVPAKDFICAHNVKNLRDANNILMDSHQSVLPVLNEHGQLRFLVFRKDITDHLDNPLQVVDDRKRLITGAAVNTHDYKERVPALVAAGLDVVTIDSSDGYTDFQKNAIEWITAEYPDLPIVGGNVVTGEGFRFLVESGAAAIKVGMGSGSICITQEQKGTGRGLATAIIKVVEERNAYLHETGKYIPVCADGGIVNSKDMSMALALGADYVMMGRYFARMEESPTEKVMINNRVMKPYWGEGSNRAREWKQQRYHQAKFAEGVEGFVEYAGKLKDNLEVSISKIRATMSTCGVTTIDELHEKAEIELVSSLSIREGKVHDIFVPENNESASESGQF